MIWNSTNSSRKWQTRGQFLDLMEEIDPSSIEDLSLLLPSLLQSRMNPCDFSSTQMDIPSPDHYPGFRRTPQSAERLSSWMRSRHRGR